MYYFLDKDNVGFPDPRLSEPDGFLAFGGGMSPEWLLNAYYMGIFPWYDDKEGTPYWYSPQRRMVLFPKEFRCSKSLTRLLKSKRMEVRVDTCFRQLMEACSKVERKAECGSSWITDNFIEHYCELHKAGFAHSFETFMDGELVGGLYGVSVSDYFCGESMFHTVTDASKVAFARMVEFALLHGFRFVDAQLYTSHLASLGAKEIDRDDFLGMLAEQDLNRTYRGRWRNNSVVLLIGGNQGDRLALLMMAIREIANRIGTVSVASSIYETEPWGFEAEQSFLNQALVVDTDLDASTVLDLALEIEKDLGRVRPEDTAKKDSKAEQRSYSSRPIDIDLIFYNSDVVENDRLVLPHPRMQQRRFVLQPLAQIIPDFRHPILRKTMSDLLEECSDKCEVKIYF